MSNSALESRVINILKNGYMPTDNKNLITFAAITTLFAVAVTSAYTLGFQQRNTFDNSSLELISYYSNLEAKIIRDYEIENNISSRNQNPKSRASRQNRQNLRSLSRITPNAELYEKPTIDYLDN